MIAPENALWRTNTAAGRSQKQTFSLQSAEAVRFPQSDLWDYFGCNLAPSYLDNFRIAGHPDTMNCLSIGWALVQLAERRSYH
jgi:hypothetical protein